MDFKTAVENGTLVDAYVVLSHSGDKIYAKNGAPMVLSAGDELHIIFPDGQHDIMVHEDPLGTATIEFMGEYVIDKSD